MAEFQWWLLLVGLVAGGALVAVVMMDGARREEDLEDDERSAEATWIAARLRASGRRADADTIETVLLLHAEYRAAPPPDEIVGGETAETAVEPRRGAETDSPSG